MDGFAGLPDCWLVCRGWVVLCLVHSGIPLMVFLSGLGYLFFLGWLCISLTGLLEVLELEKMVTIPPSPFFQVWFL